MNELNENRLTEKKLVEGGWKLGEKGEEMRNGRETTKGQMKG